MGVHVVFFDRVRGCYGIFVKGLDWQMLVFLTLVCLTYMTIEQRLTHLFVCNEMLAVLERPLNTKEIRPFLIAYVTYNKY
jgi:hypothetical protein